MTRVAAFDCGTNSLRLLVADVNPGFVEIDRRLELVRLGEGVDETGILSPAALERTFAATASFAAVARDLGATKMRFVATSATRDAQNKEEFQHGIQHILGVSPEVVSGLQEAELSFAGATAELHGAGFPGPYLVVDIGGGSTEFIYGAERATHAHSLNIGSVRLTERFSVSDPPSAEQLAELTQVIDAALAEAEARVPFSGTVIGVAGSILTVGAVALELPHYDRAAIHLARQPIDQVRATCAQLVGETRAQRATRTVIHPGRIDVIGAGALIWSRVLARVALLGQSEVILSERDILDGIARSMV